MRQGNLKKKSYSPGNKNRTVTGSMALGDLSSKTKEETLQKDKPRKLFWASLSKPGKQVKNDSVDHSLVMKSEHMLKEGKHLSFDLLWEISSER